MRVYSAVEMIINLIEEYNNPRNDEYVKQGLRNELIEIQDKINNVLRPVDFDVESLDPGERTWYYDGYGKKKLKEL